MHFTSLMRARTLIKTKSFIFYILALGFVVLSCSFRSRETLDDKAIIISFPGITHVNFNHSMKDLALVKVVTPEAPDLLENLRLRQIKMKSSLFKDKNSKLTVMIGENLNDEQLVFVLIKDNQVTQLQRIKEITKEKITLQYGKIIINTKVVTAATTQASDSL